MVFKLYKRIRALLKKRRNAKKFGVKFTRSSHWNLPLEILINNKAVKLNLAKDNSTSAAFMDVFLNDCYGLSFFKRHLHDVNTVIDIGANQGLFVLFARSVFPKASIYAYEPNQAILPNLSYHSGIANATYFNEAVGLTHGNITLHAGQDSLHGKTMLSDNGNITQVSIRECLARTSGNVDLLKLDCEGAEWEILKDTESLKKVKAITLEYHLDDEHLDVHGRDHQTIIKILQANNFKIIHQSIDDFYWGVVWAIKESS